MPKSIVPENDETLFDVVKKPLYEASELCQIHLPYSALITRSHAQEIVAVQTIGSALIAARK